MQCRCCCQDEEIKLQQEKKIFFGPYESLWLNRLNTNTALGMSWTFLFGFSDAVVAEGEGKNKKKRKA